MSTFDDLIFAAAHNEEIVSSRVGGLGGSDAALVARVGTKGLSGLTGGDKKRLAVMLGLRPYEDTASNMYTRAGHLFEDYVAEQVAGHWLGVEREKLMEQRFCTEFRTFAHADFFMPENKIVYECKYTVLDIDKARTRYRWQLQWYYLLGAKEVRIILGHGSAEPFHVDEWEVYDTEEIDEEMQNLLRRGLYVLNETLRETNYLQYICVI